MTTPESQAATILGIIDQTVLQVFQTMVSLEASPGAGSTNAPRSTAFSGMCGSVGLSGKVNGIVYTTFSEQTARHVAEKILGSDVGDPEVDDAVGELTNVVSGNLKSRLCDLGFNCTLSIPSVVRGESIRVSAKNAALGVSNEYTLEGFDQPVTVHVYATFEN
ncbi:MAG: chemotaxis protein CheX [Verrucomicrobiota bacterium]